MSDLTLVIGNQNYSSWSMRPWVLMRQLGLPFTQVKLRYQPQYSPEWLERIDQYSPTRKVPALMVGGQSVWDSLAIAETLAELFPAHGVWPADAALRRHARSVSAEMHSGFVALRTAMPMDIRLRTRAAPDATVTADIARIVALWRTARATNAAAGPFLFGTFCAADAMYAPVVMRFRSYGVELPADAAEYCRAIESLSSVQAWIADAETEYR